MVYINGMQQDNHVYLF